MLVRKFYANDIVFESGAMKRIYRGKDENVTLIVCIYAFDNFLEAIPQKVTYFNL